MPVAAVVNPARGTVIKHGVGTGPTVWTAIANVVEIDGIGGNWGNRDTTLLTDRAKGKAPTVFDSSDVTFKILFDAKSDSHTALLTYCNPSSGVPSLDAWAVTFNDATNGPTSSTCTAFVSGFEVTGITVENNLEADLTLTVSGLWVHGATAV